MTQLICFILQCRWCFRYEAQEEPMCEADSRTHRPFIAVQWYVSMLVCAAHAVENRRCENDCVWGLLPPSSHDKGWKGRCCTHHSPPVWACVCGCSIEWSPPHRRLHSRKLVARKLVAKEVARSRLSFWDQWPMFSVFWTPLCVCLLSSWELHRIWTWSQQAIIIAWSVEAGGKQRARLCLFLSGSGYFLEYFQNQIS